MRDLESDRSHGRQELPMNFMNDLYFNEMVDIIQQQAMEQYS